METIEVFTPEYYELMNDVWYRCKYGRKFTPFKIHIYIDNEEDFIGIARNLLPMLICYNLMHKVINPNHIDDLNKTNQKGKGIVIYLPKVSNEGIINFINDFDGRLKDYTINNANIKGDKLIPISKSGRLFYRYELLTVRYSDCEFDQNDKLHMLAYSHLYQSNRGDSYLARDMTDKDDIIHCAIQEYLNDETITISKSEYDELIKTDLLLAELTKLPNNARAI